MRHAAAPWHFLYFFPLPHGHGSLRPTFGSSRRTVLTGVVAADARRLLLLCAAAPNGLGLRRAARARAPSGDCDSAAGIVEDQRRAARRRPARRGDRRASSFSTGRSHHR